MSQAADLSDPNGHSLPALPNTDGTKPTALQHSTSSLSINSSLAADPLSGHVGHLNENQQQSLNAFKALLSGQGLYTEDPEPSCDEGTLLRFLRARRFDVGPALKQFKEAETFRKSANVEAFFAQHDIETYEQARRVYPCWTGRRTKQGIPFYVYRINDLDKKKMHEFFNGSNIKKNSNSKTPPTVVALYESLLQLVTPMSTMLHDRPNLETPITQSFNVVDISGVSLRQFMTLRGHLGDASALASSTYPETLHTIFVVGAPMFIGTVWGFISQWFDANTRSKIFILETNPVSNLAKLSEFLELHNIPKAYGGTLDWTPGDLPNLDPEILRAFGVDRNNWPIGPITMEGREIVAVGTTKAGKPRREIIGSLKLDAYE